MLAVLLSSASSGSFVDSLPTSPTTPRASRSSPPSPGPTCSPALRRDPRLVGVGPGHCGRISLALGAALVYTDAHRGGVRARIRPPGRHQRQVVPPHRLHQIGRLVAALLLGRDPQRSPRLRRIAAFALGLVLNLIVMTMVFLRWTFQPLEPSEADPPPGSPPAPSRSPARRLQLLLAAPKESPRIARLAPFIEGLVVMAWATATFWFPLMVAIGIWRHVVRKIPLRYHPRYWALVFPLGMYGAATYKIHDAIGLDRSPGSPSSNSPSPSPHGRPPSSACSSKGPAPLDAHRPKRSRPQITEPHQHDDPQTDAAPGTCRPDP